MTRRCTIGMYTLMLVLLFATAAIGDDATPNKEEAKAVFQSAAELFSNGDFAAAAAEFRRANAIHPTWKILYNIGQSEAAAKRYGFAVDAFEAYLSAGGDEIPVDRQEEVIAEVRRFKAKTGRLEITGPKDIVLQIDGVHIGTMPLPGKVRVSAGIVHTLKGLQNNVVVFEQNIKVSGEELATINVEPQPTAGPSAAPDEVTTETPVQALGSEDTTTNPESETSATTSASVASPKLRSPLKTAGIITLATGIGALIGGGITGGLAISKDNTLASDCQPNGDCQSDSEDLISSAKTAANASTVLFAAGGALAVTGVILLIVNKKKYNETNSTRLQPVVGPTVGIIGRF